MQFRNKKRHGASLLITILALGLLASLLAISLLRRTISESELIVNNSAYTTAQALIDACGERALLVIRNDETFTGTDSVTIGAEQCEYTVVNNGGESRTISLSTNVSNVNVESAIEVSAIFPEIVVSSWQLVD